jgi:hypothetical protein
MTVAGTPCSVELFNHGRPAVPGYGGGIVVWRLFRGPAAVRATLAISHTGSDAPAKNLIRNPFQSRNSTDIDSPPGRSMQAWTKTQELLAPPKVVWPAEPPGTFHCHRGLRWRA